VELSDLCGVHEGKPAVIIGSGPSIKDTPLHLLDTPDVVSIGVNRAYKPAFGLKRLDYLCFSDPTIVKDIVAHAHIHHIVNELKPTWLWRNAMKKFEPIGIVDHVQSFITQPIIYYDDCHSCRRKSQIAEIPLRGMETKAFYEGRASVPHVPSGNDLLPGLVFHWTTTLTALQVALMVGCDPIILVGVDHGQDKPEERHCFNDEGGGELKHVAENIREVEGKDYPLETTNDQEFNKLLDMFHREWCGQRSLFNCSPRSNLESWRRAKLEDVL